MNNGLRSLPAGLWQIWKNVRSLSYGDVGPYFAGYRTGDAELFDWGFHDVQLIELIGNVSSSTMRPPVGRFGRLTGFVRQDGTGSRTVVWPTNFLWDRLTAPTLSATAGTVDMFNAIWDGTNYRASFWTGS